MIVWSTQPLEAVEQINETGVFVCDPSRSFNLTKADSLKPAYRWLNEQMKQKIGLPPEGVEYPVWAWHTWEFERKCPDPESSAFLKRDSAKALFTLDIPESELVLTDFDAWQNVMMNTYLGEIQSDADFEAAEQLLSSLEGEELQKIIEASWQNVFKTDRIENEYMIRGRYIQATFWQIRKDYILDVKILNTNA
ncbi:MAG: DUF3841 domain-containing protein [Solobacterium sp.]|nr:DUF3841 domain-containing protein [Solobacterium sp.]